MSFDRIQLDEYNLNLAEIRIDDTVGRLVDKINSNFREIKNNGGGRKGDTGGPGRPGCRGESGTIGGAGGFGNDEIILSDSALGSLLGSCSDFTSEISQNQILINKWSNRSLLLTNLARGNNNKIELREFNEISLSENVLTGPYFDWKLKIYSSDSLGEGKHLHLLNSKAVESNENFFCNSGFTIDNNFSGSSTETLKIFGRKNSEVIDHQHRIELISDYLDLKKTDLSQIIRFEIESILDNNPKIGRFLLKEQTGDHDFRIADRQGWIGIWQDETSDLETWETIPYNEILINRAWFKVLGTDLVQDYTNSTFPFELDINSYIRFKRMNNMVIVDYHLGLKNKNTSDIVELKSIQFKVNHPTINMGCKTDGWYNHTIMEDESVNEDKLKSFGFFRVDAVQLDNNRLSFMISEKFDHQYVVVEYNELKTKFWNTGQIWTTVTDVICDELVITQDEICLTDLTLVQDGFGSNTCPYNSYLEFPLSYHNYLPFTLDPPLHPYLEDQIIVKYKPDNLLDPNNSILLVRNLDYSADAGNLYLYDMNLEYPGTLSVCYSGAWSNTGNNLIEDTDIIVFRNYEEHSIEEIGSYFGNRFRMGQTGPTGSPGTSGTSGLNGLDGLLGLKGDAGQDGTSGSSGTSGTRGTSGTSGTSGSSGTSGEACTCSGTSGTSGIGSHGTSGFDGTSGSSGTAGTNSTSGTTGISATSGTSGIGTNGTSGTSGSSGTSSVKGSSGTSGTSGTYATGGTAGV